MGSGKRVSESEKGKIKARRARATKRLPKHWAVQLAQFTIRSMAKLGKRRAKKSSRLQERRIVGEALNSFKPLSKIKRELKLGVSRTAL